MSVKILLTGIITILTLTTADASQRRAPSVKHSPVVCVQLGCTDRPTISSPPRQAINITPTVSPRTRKIVAGPAVVIRSVKTGATANVDSTAATKFQAYIDDLEQNYGAKVLFMGGWRNGKCGLANQHACGGGQALDVCQLRWGVVDSRCNLPGRKTLAAVARSHGLYEGAEWCRPDTGHVQTQFSGACNGNLYSAITKFKEDRTPSHRSF